MLVVEILNETVWKLSMFQLTLEPVFGSFICLVHNRLCQSFHFAYTLL